MHCSSPLDVAKVHLQGPQNLAQDFIMFTFALKPPICKQKKVFFFPRLPRLSNLGTAKMPSHGTV